MAELTREEKMKMIEQQLEEGIRKVYTDEMPAFLAAMSKFPDYSVNNCIMMLCQRPDIFLGNESRQLVCGIKRWNEMGRFVNKGEHGIMILAPVKKKRDMTQNTFEDDGSLKLDKDGNPVKETVTREYTTFRPVYVYADVQTHGEPIPDIVHTLTADVDGYEKLKEALVNTCEVPVHFRPIEGGANGYYSPGEGIIVVRDDLPQLQTIKTLLHEESHLALGHGSEGDKESRNVHEVTAEASAYMACCMLGLSGIEGYSAGYLISWSKDRDISELKENLEKIKNTAGMITDRVNAYLKSQEMHLQDDTKETEVHKAAEDKDTLGAKSTMNSKQVLHH